MVRLKKVILDRDRGTQLIDAQTEAAGVIGEQRIIGRQRGARRQVKVAGRSLPSEDVSGAALVTRIEPRDFAPAGRDPLLSELDLLQIGVELNRMGARRYPGDVSGQPR